MTVIPVRSQSLLSVLRCPWLWNNVTGISTAFNINFLLLSQSYNMLSSRLKHGWTNYLLLTKVELIADFFIISIYSVQYYTYSETYTKNQYNSLRREVLV